jgi:hypothetical protein
MQLYKLQVLSVGAEKALFIKRMRWFNFSCFSLHWNLAIVLDFHIICVQVFLDIVESVNLLMSSKGGLWIFFFKKFSCSFSISVLLDIIESLTRLIINDLVIIGNVLRCDVTGKVLMKCFLSGMPDLKLGLNDKIGLEKESQLKSRPAKR